MKAAEAAYMRAAEGEEAFCDGDEKDEGGEDGGGWLATGEGSSRGQERRAEAMKAACSRQKQRIASEEDRGLHSVDKNTRKKKYNQHYLNTHPQKLV